MYSVEDTLGGRTLSAEHRTTSHHAAHHSHLDPGSWSLGITSCYRPVRHTHKHTRLASQTQSDPPGRAKAVLAVPQAETGAERATERVTRVTAR